MSDLERTVREMDDPSKPVKQRAAEIAKELNARVSICHNYLFAMRKGYKSCTAFLQTTRLMAEDQNSNFSRAYSRRSRQSSFEESIDLLPPREIENKPYEDLTPEEEIIRQETEQEIRQIIADPRTPLTESERFVGLAKCEGLTTPQIRKLRAVSRQAVYQQCKIVKEKIIRSLNNYRARGY